MNCDKQVIKLIREQYELQVYTALLEMEVTDKDGKILLDAGLMVTDEETKQQMTVQSVQADGGNITVSLISPEKVTGPITSKDGKTIVPSGQAPQIYSLKDFKNKFKL